MKRRITDKQRLNWLLDNRSSGIMINLENIWFDTRRQIDAAMRAEKRGK